MKALRLVFMGTPSFALPSLERLARSRHRIAAVVTQPDRPRGRGKRVKPSPVKEWALAQGVPVLQPGRLGEEAFIGEMKKLAPDLVVTVAYGRILPEELLNLPSLGCINLHASLLPAYRGAAPIHRAVLEGAPETGVTVFKMVSELDAGDIIAREAEPIAPTDTAGTLHDRLAVKGARLLAETVDALAAGTARFTPQDPAAVSYAPPLRPEEELLRWERSCKELYNQVRGMNPWPGAYTFFNGKRLKVWRAAAAGGSPVDAPGTVIGCRGKALAVAAGDGCLELLEVQPEGKRAMSGADFFRGYRLAPGRRLGLEVGS